MLVPQISQSSLFPSLRNEKPPKQTSPFSGVFLTPLVPAALGSFPAASAAAAAAAIRASGMGSTSGDPKLYMFSCYTPVFVFVSVFLILLFAFKVSRFRDTTHCFHLADPGWFTIQSICAILKLQILNRV